MIRALPFADTDEQFARALRLAAAIYWYERGMISQGKGAEIAGLSCALVSFKLWATRRSMLFSSRLRN